MARTVPVSAASTLAGTLLNPGVPDATGDIIPPGHTRLVVTAGATPTTVTIVTTLADLTGTLPNGGGVVAANTSRVFGPFPERLFAQPRDAAVGAGQVLVNYSSVAGITRYTLG